MQSSRGDGIRSVSGSSRRSERSISSQSRHKVEMTPEGKLRQILGSFRREILTYPLSDEVQIVCTCAIDDLIAEDEFQHGTLSDTWFSVKRRILNEWRGQSVDELIDFCDNELNQYSVRIGELRDGISEMGSVSKQVEERLEAASLQSLGDQFDKVADTVRSIGKADEKDRKKLAGDAMRLVKSFGDFVSVKYADVIRYSIKGFDRRCRMTARMREHLDVIVRRLQEIADPESGVKAVKDSVDKFELALGKAIGEPLKDKYNAKTDDSQTVALLDWSLRLIELKRERKVISDLRRSIIGGKRRPRTDDEKSNRVSEIQRRIGEMSESGDAGTNDRPNVQNARVQLVRMQSRIDDTAEAIAVELAKSEARAMKEKSAGIDATIALFFRKEILQRECTLKLMEMKRLERVHRILSEAPAASDDSAEPNPLAPEQWQEIDGLLKSVTTTEVELGRKKFDRVYYVERRGVADGLALNLQRGWSELLGQDIVDRFDLSVKRDPRRDSARFITEAAQGVPSSELKSAIVTHCKAMELHGAALAAVQMQDAKHDRPADKGWITHIKRTARESESLCDLWSRQNEFLGEIERVVGLPEADDQTMKDRSACIVDVLARLSNLSVSRRIAFLKERYERRK